MVIGAVDHDNLRGRIPESLGGSQAAKTSANDQDPWNTITPGKVSRRPMASEKRNTGIMSIWNGMSIPAMNRMRTARFARPERRGLQTVRRIQERAIALA